MSRQNQEQFLSSNAGYLQNYIWQNQQLRKNRLQNGVEANEFNVQENQVLRVQNWKTKKLSRGDFLVILAKFVIFEYFILETSLGRLMNVL